MTAASTGNPRRRGRSFVLVKAIFPRRGCVPPGPFAPPPTQAPTGRPSSGPYGNRVTAPGVAIPGARPRYVHTYIRFTIKPHERAGNGYRRLLTVSTTHERG